MRFDALRPGRARDEYSGCVQHTNSQHFRHNLDHLGKAKRGADVGLAFPCTIARGGY